MPSRRLAWMAAGLAMAVALARSSPAADSAQQVATSLERLNQWVDRSGTGEGWRRYLLTEQLEAELAKGDQADRGVVRDVLARYEGEAKGLDTAPFVRVRESLAEWLAELPVAKGELPEAARAAKADFTPVTLEEVQQARSKLAEAVGRLDEVLRRDGENGQRWRSYLLLDQLNEALQADKPDAEVLKASYAKFASGHYGLGEYWFADVREAIRDYMQAVNSLDNPKLRESYEDLLDGLAKRLETYAQKPDEEEAYVIGRGIGWLSRTDRAGPLVRAIRRHYSRPNLFVALSADLVGAGIARPVDDTMPVRDTILGTTITGTGHSTGTVEVELAPSEDHAAIDTVYRGTTVSDNVGVNGPARIYSRGFTNIASRKRILIDADSIRTLPARSRASTQTKIKAVCAANGCRMIQKIATRRTYKQKGQAEVIASRHAEQKANRRVNDEADESIRQANEAYVTRFRNPLRLRRLFPDELRFSSDKSAVRIVALQAGEALLAAPGEPPALDGQPDLAVRLHQSMINNFAAEALSGMTVDEESLLREITKVLGELPEELKPAPDEEPWAVHFAAGRPVSVTFGEGTIEIALRARGYRRGEAEHPGMNVTARYKIEKTSEGTLRAIRQGPLEILPPAFKPGDTLSAGQQVIRTLLEDRMGNIFKEEIVGEGLVLPGNWSKLGTLAVSQVDATGGWLTIAWAKQAPTKVAVSVASAE